jgi:hypothetical protein
MSDLDRVIAYRDTTRLREISMTAILIANGALMAAVTTAIVGTLARAIKPVRSSRPAVVTARAQRRRPAYA